MAPGIVEQILGQRRTNLTLSWIYSSVFCCLCSALLVLVGDLCCYLWSRMMSVAWNIHSTPFSRLCLPGLIFKAVALVHHLLSLLAFWIKLLFFAQTLHLSVYWPSCVVSCTNLDSETIAVSLNPSSWAQGIAEAKQTKTLEFRAEKLLTVAEAPTQKVGDLDLSQIHLSGSPGVFKGRKGEFFVSSASWWDLSCRLPGSTLWVNASLVTVIDLFPASLTSK